jgi:predicted dehydrogenase
MGSDSLKFGLVGTGYWARKAHAAALASTEGIELAAVWGRNPRAAADLAASYGATPHEDLDAFLAAVDGLAFAVPPDVQAPIATQAARAGKHLLLEKPIALSEAEADALVDAAEQGQVATVVFFTARFQAATRAWLADATNHGGWTAGAATWMGSALTESSPFNTPWRRDKGALWDIAPHAISLLWASLGPVTSVLAVGGQADVSHLILHHESGATSTATLTLSVRPEAERAEMYLWDPSGRSPAPAEADDPLPPLRTALSELAANARSGQTAHPCDVRFGRDVNRVITEAERQIDERRHRAKED